MGFWKNLFKKGETPELVFTDETLGELIWNEDSEAWKCSINGVHFEISYEYKKHPIETTLAYARKIASNKSWLSETIEIIKTKALNEYPQSYTDEINNLTIRTLCFFDHERLHIQLFETDNEPLWFAEATNGNITDVGFDT